MLIRPNHIAAYFQCPLKANFLLFSNKKPDLTDFELLELKAKEKATDSYYRKNKTHLFTTSDLKKGFSAIWGARVKIEHFEFDCQLLLRREGKSLLGNHYYENGCE